MMFLLNGYLVVYYYVVLYNSISGHIYVYFVRLYYLFTYVFIHHALYAFNMGVLH